MSTIIECSEPTLTPLEIEDYVTDNDVAVISIGRYSMQGRDRANAEGDFLLSADESNLIEDVATAAHAQSKKVIVVLNVASIIEMESWQENVDAIVLAYLPGQEAGNVIADVLSGEVNPSGKLTQSIPVAYTDIPSASSFPGVDTDADGKIDTHYYNEGIYVGYRYYDTFDQPVSYPFGFGLSYTDFEYGSPLLVDSTLNSERAQGKVSFSVDVTNIGDVAGKDIAQVYIAAPSGRLDKPAAELKAFAKTALLAPAEDQTLVFDVTAKWLSSFDPARNQWVVEPGLYRAYISKSSETDGVYPVTFSVTSEIVVDETTPGALTLPDTVGDFETVHND